MAINYFKRFLDRSKEIHEDKYDYSLVEYVNSTTKVKIICPIHGEFNQTPRNHLQKRGCTKCGYEKNSNNRRKTTKEFITESQKLHGDKYDYSLVKYINSSDKVKIICPIHGEFEQIADAHLSGKGCSQCRYDTLRDRYSKTSKEFILESQNLHGDKYDYSLVEYVNSKTKVKIICPIHGEILISPLNHLRSQGCNECSKTRISSTEEFVRRARLTHGDKYDYNLVEYLKSSDKIKIICPIHGEFEQSPRNHLFENGCPKCNNNGVSNKEKELVDFIKSIYTGDIIENDRTILDGKELDIYLPERNLAIEFNGLYWHNQKNLEKRGVISKTYHLKKTTECKNKGIRLVHIFEDEWDNKKNHVESRLRHFLGIYKYKIGARQTKIRTIPASIRREFLEENHIQGKDGAAFSYGAFYKETLVGIMSFCRPRVSMGMKGSSVKENMYELSRFAVESGYQVFGLASKMFKHFLKEEDVDIVYTYSDLRWNKFHGTGTVYEMIGMKYVSSSSPSYFYIKDMKREYRFKYRKNVLSDKLKTFDPILTEYENCLNNGLDRIWDCGCDKYMYENKGEIYGK